MAQQNVPLQEAVGTAFVDAFYNQFDVDRLQCYMMYHPEALLTFNTFMAQGHQGILNIYQNQVQFKTVKHLISSRMFQPMADGGILILVIGKLIADADMPLDFSETFVLKNVDGNWMIINDVFRLVLHDV